MCVLNRKGRVRLLACRSCGRLTTCEHCGSAVAAAAVGLACGRCGRTRPAVCQSCGSTALRAARVGVAKLREDLETLARLPVGEVTAAVDDLPATPILVGTEAVLHRRTQAAVVVFLDFDAELLAPRFRAPEDALALLALGARAVGRRDGGGRLVVQTRLPDHLVLQAALRADPGRLAERGAGAPEELGLPPATALAEISGDADVGGPAGRRAAAADPASRCSARRRSLAGPGARPPHPVRRPGRGRPTGRRRGSAAADRGRSPPGLTRPSRGHAAVLSRTVSAGGVAAASGSWCGANFAPCDAGVARQARFSQRTRRMARNSRHSTGRTPRQPPTRRPPPGRAAGGRRRAPRPRHAGHTTPASPGEPPRAPPGHATRHPVTSVQPERAAFRLVDHRILEGADRLDVDPHRVPGRSQAGGWRAAPPRPACRWR